MENVHKSLLKSWSIMEGSVPVVFVSCEGKNNLRKLVSLGDSTIMEMHRKSIGSIVELQQVKSTIENEARKLFDPDNRRRSTVGLLFGGQESPMEVSPSLSEQSVDRPLTPVDSLEVPQPKQQRSWSFHKALEKRNSSAADISKDAKAELNKLYNKGLTEQSKSAEVSPKQPHPEPFQQSTQKFESMKKCAGVMGAEVGSGTNQHHPNCQVKDMVAGLTVQLAEVSFIASGHSPSAKNGDINGHDNLRRKSTTDSKAQFTSPKLSPTSSMKADLTGTFSVLVIGSGGTGKSSLITKMEDIQCSDLSTCEIRFFEIDEKNSDLWDSLDADAAIYVFAKNDATSLRSAMNCLLYMRNNSPNIASLLLGTKSDTVMHQNDDIDEKIHSAKQKCKSLKVPYLEATSYSDDSIQKVWSSLYTALLKKHKKPNELSFMRPKEESEPLNRSRSLKFFGGSKKKNTNEANKLFKR